MARPCSWPLPAPARQTAALRRYLVTVCSRRPLRGLVLARFLTRFSPAVEALSWANRSHCRQSSICQPVGFVGKVGGVIAKDRRLQQPSLVRLAAAAVRDMVLSGELRPGDRLVEERLTEELGISRPPLREALRLLEQE